MSGELNIQELSYRPGASLPCHHHALASLSLTLEGEHRELLGRRRYDCPTYSAVLKDGDIEHTNEIGPAGTRGLFVELSPDIADSLARAGAAPLGAICFVDVPTRSLVRRIDHELRFRHAGSDLVVESLVLELLGALLRTRLRWGSRGGDAWLGRAIDYLEANYREQLRVADVAAACGVHPSHLAEIFRHRFAVSVGEWVRNRRLEFARQALLDPREPVAEVAFAAGFADQSHLTRLFRARFGLTPAAYRRAQTRRSF